MGEEKKKNGKEKEEKEKDRRGAREQSEQYGASE